MRFDLLQKSKTSLARRGQVVVRGMAVATPGFMSIGTAGSVKSLSNQDLIRLGAGIILGNTYHLWVKPGLDVLRQAGGLHRFAAHNFPLLTDSGGFQAFSLAKTRTLNEEGVTFREPKSGDKYFLSPQVSMQIQAIIGSDITLVLDELLPAECTKNQAREAMLRTRRWAERSLQEFQKISEDGVYCESILGQSQKFNPTAVLFGIPQGAQYEDLRVESAKLTMELDFAGYSVGGVANGGEPEEVMYAQVLSQTQVLEEHKPRHLLGVGTPQDIVQMVARGIDLFDCVYPTRNARHGSILFEVDGSSYQEVQITSKQYEFDFEPINPDSELEELRMYSKSYLRHLLRSKELLGMRLATLQNLDFYYRLMATIRAKIEQEQFDTWWEGYKRV